MKETNTPLISIIVPVYNVEQYLPKCIDSILAQTYTNFEVLLINDGSPDNCGAICDRYAEQDNRIRVFHKENGGVSSARNVGLDNARGEWIFFVDSDDWLYAGKLMDLDIENIPQEIDLIQVNSNIESLIDGLIQNNLQWYYYKYTEDFILDDFCKSRLFSGAVWSKILRRSKIRNLTFHEDIKVAEDFLFMTQYLYGCNKIRILNIKLYNYRYSLDSVMRNLTEDSLLDNLRVADILYDFQTKNKVSKVILTDIKYKILQLMIWYIQQLPCILMNKNNLRNYKHLVFFILSVNLVKTRMSDICKVLIVFVQPRLYIALIKKIRKLRTC